MATNRELIERAMGEIRQAKEGLDVACRPCPTCGLNHYSNWSEKQAAETLGGAYAKLSKLFVHEELRGWLDREAKP